jgi:lipoprotein-releasing system permease protein
MITPVEFFIARRYLRAKRKIRFINVISYISIIGIAIGVAALLVALSVFNGFSGVVTSVLIGFDPHLRIEKKGGFGPEEYTQAVEHIQKTGDVHAFAPFVSGKAMLSSGSFNRVVYLKGMDQADVGEVTGLKNRLVLGEIAFRDSSGLPGIVIGLTLADRLAAVVGNDIIVYSPQAIQTAFTGISMPGGMKFRVTGIYESNNKEYDGSYAFISLGDARVVFDAQNRLDGIEVRLQDYKRSEEFKDKLLRSVPAGTVVSTWFDLHKSLYTVMRIERWTGYVLLSLIILVATFNMLGSLTMGVIEKERDISVLQAMGMTRKNISRLFMTEGLFLGIVGTIAGIAIGIVVLYLQMEYNIFPLDTTVYIIPAIPVEIRWSDFLLIGCSSVGLSWLAAWYPAHRAAAIAPAKGLRWE